MSHVAIAAALALEDVSAGERLAAFSLASFANREHRAWPGTRVAATRAGLSRSQYLAAREGLQKRGLVAVEESGGGRGRSPVVALLFARTGPWFEGEVNAALFEAVLGYSRARGAARLLLASLAAAADQQLEVRGLSTGEIRAAAGMADSTYRRARAGLLASGELVVAFAGGGRAKLNRWRLREPRLIEGEPAVAPRTRVAPSGSTRPLIAIAKKPRTVQGRDETMRDPGRADEVKGPGLSGVCEPNPGQIRTVCAGKGLGLTGVSRLNPGQDRTVSSETPPQTPPETPPPSARAGREPQNPRTNPPCPPEGGSRAGAVTIVEEYVTDRGRKRQRTITVELDDVRGRRASPSAVDRADWGEIRRELQRITGESVFEIWLSKLELVAIDRAAALVIACPPAARAWVAERFGRLLARTARSAGRELRLATRQELQLVQALAAPDAERSDPSFTHPMSHDEKEAV